MGTELHITKWQVLEVGGSDGRTRVDLLDTMNCTLKMLKVVNFKLCVFYHNKKRKDIIVGRASGASQDCALLRKRCEPQHGGKLAVRARSGGQAWATLQIWPLPPSGPCCRPTSGLADPLG